MSDPLPEAYVGRSGSSPFPDGLFGHPQQFPFVLDPKDDLTPKESLEITVRIMAGMENEARRKLSFHGVTVNEAFMNELPPHLLRHFSVRKGVEDDD